VIVLDLAGANIDAESTKLINGLIASLASENKDLELTTGSDLRASLDVEVQRQSAGCSASSCLGEIAGALGARYIVHGDLGKVGSDIVINLSLFDSTVGTALSHTTTTLPDLGVLRAKLRPDMHALLAPLGGLPPDEAPTPVLAIAGAGALGVGVVAGVVGGAFAFAADGVAADADKSPADKKAALRDGLLWLTLAAGGTVVAAGGGAVLAYDLLTE
jgi:hypothetical protein